MSKKDDAKKWPLGQNHEAICNDLQRLADNGSFYSEEARNSVLASALLYIMQRIPTRDR